MTLNRRRKLSLAVGATVLMPAVVRGFAQPGTRATAATRPVALALAPARPANPEAPDRVGLPPATIDEISEPFGNSLHQFRSA